MQKLGLEQGAIGQRQRRGLKVVSQEETAGAGRKHAYGQSHISKPQSARGAHHSLSTDKKTKMGFLGKFSMKANYVDSQSKQVDKDSIRYSRKRSDQDSKERTTIASLAASIALGVSIATMPAQAMSPYDHHTSGLLHLPLAKLTSANPISNPRSLLRYALPINDVSVKQIQDALESIREDLR